MLNTLFLLAAESSNESQGPFWAPFVPIILMLVLFYFLIIMPARRRERQQREDLFSRLKKNDEVITSAGIIGIVAHIKDKEDEVVLKVDESSNVRLRVLKSSIVRILTPKDAAGKTTPAAESNQSQAVKAGAPPAKS